MYICSCLFAKGCIFGLVVCILSCNVHVPLAVALIDGQGSAKSAKGSAERPLGVAATPPQPHSDLTHQCNAASSLVSREKPQSFLTFGRWWRLPPRNASHAILHGKIWQIGGGRGREREQLCSGKFEQKRRRLMPLLILNGEKSDKSSWHNNACNDLASKFSNRCSEFIMGRLEKLREENLIVKCKILSGKELLWEWDCKAVRVILSQSSCADCRGLKCFSTDCFYQLKVCKSCSVGRKVK